jgi:organic radical activating enzyme
MPKLHIPYAEFYIINVCNLACSGCNRFNDYNFTGYQRWSDYADVYKQWAEQVDIGSIGILGGEPLLNPTFLEWVQGINQLWPNKKLRIISNGFRLDRHADLYPVLEQHRNIELWVGIHNKQHKSEIIQKVRDFGQAPHTVTFNTDNPYQQYMTITDARGVRIKIEYNWWFHQGAIIKQDGALTLHQSDVAKAHDICHMKTCHHFIRGELYKCGVAAVLPEFDQQHPLTLSTADRELMLSYRPLRITDDAVAKQQFVSNLDQPIDQCRFCPEQYNGDQIFAQQKKDLK